MAVETAPPPPLLPDEDDEEDDEDDDAAEIVTLFVPVAVPPGVPVAETVNAHVAAEDGAVTLQLTELVPVPATVPTVLVADDIVHPPLPESVAVIAVEVPAVSVPPLDMVTETVNASLVLTDAGAVTDATLSSAADVTVMVPQSAVHVVPSATHTSWPPVAVGVIEKSALPVPPACMLEIVVVVDEAVNQLPSN